MSKSATPTQTPRVPHLPIRSRRVIGRDGEELVATSVYCPVRETSVAVSRCEACQHFHALHFDPATLTTSVACHCEGAASAPLGEERRRDAGEGTPDPLTPLAHVMSKSVVCVHADTDLDTVTDLLVRHSISGMPVVDAGGRAIGVVSRADVIRDSRERRGMEEVREGTARPRDRDVIEPGSHVVEPTRITAGEAMTPVVFSLHESANIGQAAALMAFEGVHRLPVVADHGEVVGILSALDVLKWFGRRSGYLIPSTPQRR